MCPTTDYECAIFGDCRDSPHRIGRLGAKLGKGFNESQIGHIDSFVRPNEFNRGSTIQAEGSLWVNLLTTKNGDLHLDVWQRPLDDRSAAIAAVPIAE
jgi:hypothetical protein